jgi:hypothetical protein
MGIMGSTGTASGAPVHSDRFTIIGMDLSVVLGPADPVNPDVSSWATPVFGIVYLALVIVALASLVASRWISTPVKAVVAVAVLALPFVGAVAWIAYSLVRRRGAGKQHKNS